MCGIAGIVSRSRAGRSADFQFLLQDMGDRLAHRGPDSHAVWFDARTGVGFSHRRLSIVDTSPTGNQPMESADGRLCLCLNGEIYNHRDLREELLRQGCSFRGTSDTEVFLSAIQNWGLDVALERAIGMYAFALVDTVNQTFHLVRDRMGEKPLYYGWVGNDFVFASELKAFEALPEWRPEIDHDALGLFFRHNYVPAPLCIFKDIWKLPPASIVDMQLSGSLMVRELEPRRYWSPFAACGGEAHDDKSLEALITDSVKRQMVADVPVGAFLSGGVDSSTIVALMNEHAHHPVKTFTIGFDEAEFDESKHAEAVAAHLGTEHRTFILSPRDALDLIPTIPDMYDEPFADASQLPTFLVSKMTRAQVTVALSGDGGDELFCGYERYFIAQKAWSRLQKLKQPLRKLLSQGIGRLPVRALGWPAVLLNRIAPAPEGKFTSVRLAMLAYLAGADNFDEFYRRVVSFEPDPGRLVPAATEQTGVFGSSDELNPESRWNHMMARDMQSYLPDDILVKVDRASMATSLETRVPLLSHDVVEAAWSRRPMQNQPAPLPTKQVLRNILYKRVPREMIERPKTGFAIPLGPWLAGPLREWARDLLSPEFIRRQGILDDRFVSRLARDHFDHGVDYKFRLWNILVFQAWMHRYMPA